MNEVVKGRQTEWSNSQAYLLAGSCLVIGLVFGYLLHGGSSGLRPAAVDQSAVGVNPHSSQVMPSPEQLKHMGDKMAEPLLKDLEEKKESSPKNAETLERLASIYFQSGQYPLAIEYYEKALKTKPSAEGYVSLSNTYHRTGDDDKAIAMLNRALEVDPKSANALFNLGMLDWKTKKDPNAAIRAWQQLLDSNPNHPQRARVEAMISRAQQDIKQGEKSTTVKSQM